MTNNSLKDTSILVTGGAGYIGSTLVPLLLDLGYRVTVYDIFRWGVQPLFSVMSNPQLNLICADVTDWEKLMEQVSTHDIIIHLAAIVGYPACEKEPERAIEINQTSVEKLCSWLRPEQKLIFSSTGSCYGAVFSDEIVCTEETPAKPVSLYGATKHNAERQVIGVDGVVLRLATVFGISPRFRCDLLIHDLLRLALKLKTFDIYEGHFKRTFVHVRDVARAFVMAIDKYEEMKGQVYNVGDETLNYTKMEIAKMIENKVEGAIIIENKEGQDMDKRNYQVSFRKIRELGFKTTITIEEGLENVLKFLDIVDDKEMMQFKNTV